LSDGIGIASIVGKDMDADTIGAFIGQGCVIGNVGGEDEDALCLARTVFQLLYKLEDGRRRILTLV
jgi:hypothetical protein